MPQPATTNPVHCRYGAQCTRRDCPFQHPPSHPLSKAAAAATQPCRFGAACTRAACPYQHPEGRVLPTSFHRGVATNAPIVNVQSPQTGSMGAPSPHKSVIFNTASKTDIERKIKELQEEKDRTEQAVRDAEAAAAAGKKESDESKRIVTLAA
jgi:nuclear polyadenylated RNA-binding protein NAB2